jgi:predicted metal-dependent peptidase
MSYDKLAARRELRGGGGTDMRVALNYITKQGIDPSAVVVLTDLYTPFPKELSHPTLWVSTTKGITAPCGVTTYI